MSSMALCHAAQFPGLVLLCSLLTSRCPAVLADVPSAEVGVGPAVVEAAVELAAAEAAVELAAVEAAVELAAEGHYLLQLLRLVAGLRPCFL